MFSRARGVFEGQAGNLVSGNVRLSVLERGNRAGLPLSRHWDPSHRGHTWGHFTRVSVRVWGWDALQNVLKTLFLNVFTNVCFLLLKCW